jgi:hypothetical protein
MAIAAKWLLNCIISYTIIGIGVSASVTQLTWLGWLVFIAVLAWSGAWSWAGSVTGTKAVGDVFGYAFRLASRLFPNLISAPKDRTSRAIGDIVGAAALLVVGAVAIAWTVAGAGGVLWRGSWEWVSGYGWVFAGLWWGSWPLTLGMLPGFAADDMENHKALAVGLLTLAAGVGLAIGWFIYHTVHPA